MKITEVNVFPARSEGREGDSVRLKAYATIVFDDAFIVRDLKIIEGNRGLFVSMPSRKRRDGSFRDIVHPLHSDMRRVIEERVIGEYNRMVEGGNKAASSYDDESSGAY